MHVMVLFKYASTCCDKQTCAFRLRKPGADVLQVTVGCSVDPITSTAVNDKQRSAWTLPTGTDSSQFNFARGSAMDGKSAENVAVMLPLTAPAVAITARVPKYCWPGRHTKPVSESHAVCSQIDWSICVTLENEARPMPDAYTVICADPVEARFLTEMLLRDTILVDMAAVTDPT